MLRSVIGLLAMSLASACGETSYTLYRDGRFGGPPRVHVATFDANESKEYNRHNCEEVARLFTTQPGVTEGFWCEPGRYRS
jgi:hypothetical protein